MSAGAAQNIGAIYASHIVPPLVHTDPTPENPNIPTAAASITFFRTSDANRFLVTPFTVDGFLTTATRHRIRTRETPVNGRSRVLVIRGSPSNVNPVHLQRIFREDFGIKFDVDFIRQQEQNGLGEVIFAFGSFRAQAQAAYIGLRKHFRGSITVCYGPDPCDPKATRFYGSDD